MDLAIYVLVSIGEIRRTETTDLSYHLVILAQSYINEHIINPWNPKSKSITRLTHGKMLAEIYKIETIASGYNVHNCVKIGAVPASEKCPSSARDIYCSETNRDKHTYF